MAIFWISVAASLVLPRLPFARNIFYPFALLGTWAHEMGHGLMGAVLGGGFERLEIYSNLGGVAYTSGVGSLARVLVSAAGLLGPAIFGGLVIVFGSKTRASRFVLIVLGVVVLLSVVLVVRNTFGFIALTVIGVALTGIGLKAPDLVRLGLTQLIGVQMCLASWGSLDYMFTKNFQRNGRIVDSDTQNIADVLFAPYWFWGGVIAALSAAILGYSYYRAWIKPHRTLAEIVPGSSGTL